MAAQTRPHTGGWWQARWGLIVRPWTYPPRPVGEGARVGQWERRPGSYRVMVKVVRSVTVWPPDLAVMVAVASPAQWVLTRQRQV